MSESAQNGKPLNILPAAMAQESAAVAARGPAEISAAQPMDLEAVRARLAGKSGRAYWRSLEELAETPEFEQFLNREFPENHSEWHDGPGRRDFLKLMGASLALAGLAACSKQPPEKIVPYVRAPEEFIPGIALQYATAMTIGGYARGVLATSHMGRPTKLEGNELHPASLGSSDIFTQASILQLYDPDRSQVVQNAGRISTFSEFLAAAQRVLAEQKAKKGAGLRILTETVTSPTLAGQIQNFLGDYPDAKWHQYEPANQDMARAGARMAFGTDVDTQYRFEKASVILSLDADFLSPATPGGVRYARDFSSRRNARVDPRKLNRLYAIESTPSISGAMADHRLTMRAADVEAFAHELRRRFLKLAPSGESELARKHDKWIDAVVRDLSRNRGTSIVVAGQHQSAAVHSLAHALNDLLGNTGSTVIYTDPVEAQPAIQMASLKSLAAEMASGTVEVLLMFGGNPAYNAPADLKFAAALEKVAFRAHLSLYADETSNLCHWHLPDVHFLEAWGDARAFDGTATIQQPLIAPLYGAKSALEVLSALAGRPGVSGYDLVRNYWKTRIPAAEFEKTWRSAVHDGVVPGTSLPARSVSLAKDFDARLAAQPKAGVSQKLEINFRTDPTVFDGRYSNLGWLQELPKSLTKLTWDNAVLLSPKTAAQRHLHNEDVVALRCGAREESAPVWILPGHPDDSVTVHLGYGRWRAGRVGSQAGFSGYALQGSDAPWFSGGLELGATGARYALAVTQNHSSMEGRNLVREGSVEEYEKHPDFVREMGEEPPSELTLYPGHKYTGYAWGMAIDLTACIGCNACTTACQAENNIPIVGKTQVRNAREMHWIRVDRYFEGSVDSPSTVHQPVPCMQCENAPCEVVCPVAATSHSAEGLNDMVYNRCVGTRYCSNNCPYKVRRFNFLSYTDEDTPVLKLLRNPNVTVRTRGVMEKCTYCVQRINAARITSEKEGRSVHDGEIRTACQQACPAQAIVFGDINDPKSEVSRWKASRLNYGLLAEVNTRPRTTYLAKLRNPNPELES